MGTRKVFTSTDDSELEMELECWGISSNEICIDISERYREMGEMITLDLETAKLFSFELIGVINDIERNIRLNQLQSEIDETDNESKVANGK